MPSFVVERKADTKGSGNVEIKEEGTTPDGKKVISVHLRDEVKLVGTGVIGKQVNTEVDEQVKELGETLVEIITGIDELVLTVIDLPAECLRSCPLVIKVKEISSRYKKITEILRKLRRSMA